jgi:DNA invertase Pin-like site-specific DNA recombinase
MIDAALTKPPTFTLIVVHSFSRFFRDQFQFEFYVRKLAKNGVRLISITQDLGDDPMSVMMRQIMTLFDEYQSKENATHTMRAMKESARILERRASAAWVSNRGGEATRPENQEEARDRSDPRRDRPADLSARAQGRRR